MTDSAVMGRAQYGQYRQFGGAAVARRAPGGGSVEPRRLSAVPAAGAAAPSAAAPAVDTTPGEPRRAAVLTSRERQVLLLVADGLSTREVARQLCYSERTIKNVLQALTTRLQMRNRTHAVAQALRNGWI